MNSTLILVNKSIPPILQEVSAIRTQVMPKTLTEIKEYRLTTIPDVLKESANLRKALPPLMVEANQLVEKAEVISQKATEGAVKGVILSPVNLIKDAGSAIKSTVTD